MKFNEKLGSKKRLELGHFSIRLGDNVSSRSLTNVSLNLSSPHDPDQGVRAFQFILCLHSPILQLFSKNGLPHNRNAVERIYDKFSFMR